MKDHHSHYADDEFILSLLNGSFPSKLFTHEAHLRLAWIFLEDNNVEEACEDVSAVIKAYVALIGAEDKYHETITQAAVRAVYHFKNKKPSNGFSMLVASFPRLLTHFK